MLRYGPPSWKDTDWSMNGIAGNVLQVRTIGFLHLDEDIQMELHVSGTLPEWHRSKSITNTLIRAYFQTGIFRSS